MEFCCISQSESFFHSCFHLICDSTQASAFFIPMVVAWSITEIIRYSNYAATLLGLRVRPLEYLRWVPVTFLNQFDGKQIHALLCSVSAWSWLRSYLHLSRGASCSCEIWRSCPLHLLRVESCSLAFRLVTLFS